mgnify:CR=1 FL=1
MSNLTKPENKNAEVIIPLKDLISAFVEARDKINELKTAFDKEIEPLKIAKEQIQAQIIKTFHDRGEFTTRIEGATATLSVRKTAVVVDEPLVISQLKSKGLDNYISESLNDLFDNAKKNMADGIDELLDGMAIKETEFISVRSNKKSEPRKVTTEQYVKIGGSHDK